MSVARCRCGKTKSFKGQRRHFTCAECLQVRQAEREATAVEISCAGCGRTNRIPAKQARGGVVGYTCGHGRCKAVPDFRPDPPIGWYTQVGYEVVGGFHGYSFKQHTPETLAAVWRACEIRDAAMELMRERQGR